MGVEDIQRRLRSLADKDKARILQGFFKTAPGQYGEGDIFIGLTVPVLRKLVKEFDNTSVADAYRLLKSSIHEERLLALLMLIRFYSTGDNAAKSKIFSLYIDNTRYINNWDLVDLSAPNIVGVHLADRNRKQLYAFARSNDLWKRRISIISTLTFIRQNDFNDTLRISKILLSDEHDLIHKAVGWMLRELGKRSSTTEEQFLKQHYRVMPRTMLRYSIERFPEVKRKRYLNGKI